MNQNDPNDPQGELPDIELSEDSRDVPTVGRVKRSSMISRVVIIGVLLVVIFLLGKFLVSFLSGNEAEPADLAADPVSIAAPALDPAKVVAPTPAPVETKVLTSPEPVKPDSTTMVVVGESSESQPLAQAELDPQSRILLLEKKLELLSQELKSQLSTLAAEQKKVQPSQTEGMSSEISAKLMDEVEALKQKIDNNLPEVTHKMTAQEELLAGLSGRLTVLEGATEAIKKNQEKVDQVKKGLPFRVLSVDVWNGKPYVAVGLEEKTSLITLGDLVMGWKVDTIDFDGQKVVFIKNGEKVDQAITR